MSASYDTYGMTPQEFANFLTEQQQNGYTALSQRDRQFALEFVQTGSYVEAAKAVGVTPPTGARLLKDPLVSSFIHHLNQRKEHYSLIDASFIETQYLVLFAKLSGEVPVPVVDKDGISRDVRKFDGAAAVSALRDMAKISGNYREDGTLKIGLLTQDLTDEQKKLLGKAVDELF